MANITITENATRLAVTEQDAVTVITETNTQVLEVAPVVVTVESSETSPLITAQAVSALRAIATNASGLAVYADHAGASNVFGVSTNAVGAGGTCHVRYTGVMSDAGWSWVPGPVYVGVNGALTQTAPTSGYVCQVGIATKATEININVQQPIVIG